MNRGTPVCALPSELCCVEKFFPRQNSGWDFRGNYQLPTDSTIASPQCAVAAVTATPKSFSFARARRSSSVPG